MANPLLSRESRFKTVGRPPGAINHATRRFKEFWHQFFSSEEYRETAKQRILNGDAPHLEGYLLARVYGRPKETIDLNVGVQEHEDLSDVSYDELIARTQKMLTDLQEAKQITDAIPAEYKTPEATSYGHELLEEIYRQRALRDENSMRPPSEPDPENEGT